MSTVRVERADAGTEGLRELRFRVGEMDCPSCLAKIEGHLGSLEGVCAVSGSVLSRTRAVTLDEGRVDGTDVQAEVARLGYAAEPVDDVSDCFEGTSC